MMRFSEQVAVITGAASGLGRAYSLALAQRGAKIALIDSGYADTREDNERAELEATVTKLKALGADVLDFCLDVRDEEGLVQAVNRIHQQWGRIDILIHSASIHQTCMFDAITKEQWQAQWDIDVHGCFYLTKLIWPLMKQQNYGRIVVSSAASGLYGNMYETSFSTSKMALIGFVNSLSMEGAEHNICVNSITPHALTKMTENHLAPSVKSLFSTSSVNAVLLYLCTKLAPTGKHLLVAAGSVSHGGFTEFRHIRIGEDNCKPESVHEHWQDVVRAPPCCHHASGEDQVTAWAKRCAMERGLDIGG
ncbi:SDR family NAD(P)-dependent oxidoreductase [Shewanella sp. AS1]|uniref:SDR family NAD(P)-dependent oxidoreductase n=1 Tax=Shewanella sp. AS1 TaxID=2907626 RepID=UPI001F1A52FA|nr:SDR family NAD(P)-dependent oxidoreductase [Shewanella sp. AS1]MCE9678211.1 SDR family NAD(P)-dependent oxidoreductase [Shewanella sp. AS1]